MVSPRTSSICLSAKETRVSDNLIIQTTANRPAKCKETEWSSFLEWKRQDEDVSEMKSVKFAVAKETERFAKAKRMFNDNLEA